ncbi:MAG TPA: SMI1/KNR4 family protein [Pseudomonadales bacterium]|nr:SMI1/KNR4 family protein [Pseudomonadales bacterium]
MDINELKKRLRDAIDKGIVARHDFYESLQLDDEQLLGPPAPEIEIQALEKHIKRILPDSYRTFLAMHNGWKMASAALDLLSTTQLLDPQIAQDIADWQADMKRHGDEVAARSLVIGFSDINATKYLLDPAVQNKDGEWRMVKHYHEEEADYESFLAWLEESIEDYSELAKMDHGDEEPAPDDDEL